jgi:hypothetical protein
MMSGIRAKPKKRRDKLDPRSRIDFARMYTVEHNVKVYDFGAVDKLYLERLLNQWLIVLLGGKSLSNYGSEYLTSIAETRLDDGASVVTASSRNSKNHPPRQKKSKGKMKDVGHLVPAIASSDSGVADVMHGPQSITSSHTYINDVGVEMGYT